MKMGFAVSENKLLKKIYSKKKGFFVTGYFTLSMPQCQFGPCVNTVLQCGQ